MRRLYLLLLLPLLVAATVTDTSSSDFLNGTLVDVDVMSNSLILNTTGVVYVNSGNFTSRVMDMGSNPTVAISWNLATPAGTSLFLSTRSGSNSTDFTGWSSWSSAYGSSGSTVTSPMNRYYQYRAQLITTDTSATPVLTDVTLSSTEANTSITKASTNANLTETSTGSYDFQAVINDTYQIINVSGRYKVDSGAFSTSVPMTAIGSSVYNLTIPDLGWSTYSSENLTLEVTAYRTNGSVNDSVTAELYELIDYLNTAPVLDPISNQSLAQDETMNITVTGTDADNHTLTFTTNNSAITVTSLTTSSASLTWTPGANYSGNHTVTVYANDSYTTASRNFTVSIDDVNDVPTISIDSAISGYWGIRLAVILTGYDPDDNTTLNFSVSPPFFSIATALSTGNYSAGSGYQYGIANFTPADPEKGVHNITFTVTDGEASANVNTTMTINYCGDLVCQTSYETADSCAVDCATVTELEKIALIVPDRNCANTSMVVSTFNATNRFSCYYQGLVEEGLALCEPLSSVSIAVFERNGSLLTSAGSLSTDTWGEATFTPPRAGEYKFSATRDGFANTSTIVFVRSCDQDIVVRQENRTIEQPEQPERPEQPTTEQPTEENPIGVTQEEATLLQAMLFYVVAPLLAAMLIYAGNVFYDVNKDNLPILLQIRIAIAEQWKKIEPQRTLVWAKLSPFITPVIQSLQALYDASLRPLVEKLKQLLKRK